MCNDDLLKSQLLFAFFSISEVAKSSNKSPLATSKNAELSAPCHKLIRIRGRSLECETCLFASSFRVSFSARTHLFTPKRVLSFQSQLHRHKHMPVHLTSQIVSASRMSKDFCSSKIARTPSSMTLCVVGVCPFTPESILPGHNDLYHCSLSFCDDLNRPLGR